MSQFTIRVSKRKDKKYDAVFDDGRVVSFGGIRKDGRPYQQYRDTTPLRAYREYDHLDLRRRNNFYKRHGSLTSSKPYSADYFSKKFLW